VKDFAGPGSAGIPAGMLQFLPCADFQSTRRPDNGDSLAQPGSPPGTRLAERGRCASERSAAFTPLPRGTIPGTLRNFSSSS